MTVDGVVIKCSRTCNKHKYFVPEVEKVMNASVSKPTKYVRLHDQKYVVVVFVLFLFFTEDMLWVLKQLRLNETFLLTTNECYKYLIYAK